MVMRVLLACVCVDVRFLLFAWCLMNFKAGFLAVFIATLALKHSYITKQLNKSRRCVVQDFVVIMNLNNGFQTMSIGYLLFSSAGESFFSWFFLHGHQSSL